MGGGGVPTSITLCSLVEGQNKNGMSAKQGIVGVLCHAIKIAGAEYDCHLVTHCIFVCIF